jgi:aspartyl-tRNA(Asn)/glutamyl-tRNA(Gln) amidotransferase subunit A
MGALGSDTGGSIRIPAACCGIAGLKPTYGRVSRAGVMPLSWSLDHVGPMTRTARDAALILAVIAGHDPRDATSSRRGLPAALDALDRRVAGLRLGVPENYYFDGVAPEVEASVRAALEAFEALGVAVKTVRVPDPATLVEASTILSRCESATIHARLVRERPHELQPVVRARLEVGLHVSAYDYLQAARLRSRLAREFITEVFAEVDTLVAPVVPEPAPSLAAVKAGSLDDVLRRTARFARLTRPFNGLGLPALAIPSGTSGDGRPLAFQLVGRPFEEATVLRLGHAYELETGATSARPSLE